jgi:hypothetical protein
MAPPTVFLIGTADLSPPSRRLDFGDAARRTEDAPGVAWRFDSTTAAHACTTATTKWNGCPSPPTEDAMDGPPWPRPPWLPKP